jgi:hypothetical protein
MTRTMGSVMLLVSLAVAAAIFGMSSRNSGPTSKTVTHAEVQAQAEASTLDFSQATMAMQAYQAENGTFAGASLPPAYGVTVARADATSYCLQAGAGAAMQHVVGPGGSAQPGACA